MMCPILRMHQCFFGSAAIEHVQAYVPGIKFQLTFGVHEQLSARALNLNASVARRHGSDRLCHVAVQMSEGALQFTAPVGGGVDVTGDSAPGRMSREHCLHCAFDSRCQSGTGARGASIRHSVSDVAEEHSDTVDANPELWVLGPGNIFHEHQTCIGLYLTACLVQFSGATPHVALDIDPTIGVAWYLSGPSDSSISIVPGSRTTVIARHRLCGHSVHLSRIRRFFGYILSICQLKGKTPLADVDCLSGCQL
jgi:hypothetical protein